MNFNGSFIEHQALGSTRIIGLVSTNLSCNGTIDCATSVFDSLLETTRMEASTLRRHQLGLAPRGLLYNSTTMFVTSLCSVLRCGIGDVWNRVNLDGRARLSSSSRVESIGSIGYAVTECHCNAKRNDRAFLLPRSQSMPSSVSALFSNINCNNTDNTNNHRP
jgi:hypothetical protein